MTESLEALLNPSLPGGSSSAVLQLEQRTKSYSLDEAVVSELRLQTQKTPLCFEWRFLRERWRCALRPPGLFLGGSSAGFPMSPFLLRPSFLELFHIRSPVRSSCLNPMRSESLRTLANCLFTLLAPLFQDPGHRFGAAEQYGRPYRREAVPGFESEWSHHAFQQCPWLPIGQVRYQPIAWW